jgi:hypothetical protein
MAMTLAYNPGTYYSAHGDIIFTVLDSVKASDPVTYPDYKYVCDVYMILGGVTLVARLKAVPHPDSKVGIFNVGSIVRNYLSNTQFNPAASQLRAQKLGNIEFYITAQMQFGEEYGFTTYTNVLTDAQRTYFNHYNGRLLGQNTSLINYLDKVMSVRPATTSVYRSATFSFIPFLATDDTTINLVIKSYNGGGLVATTTQPFTPTAASFNEQQLFNVSPAAINAASPGFISSFITYYTVEFSTTNITDDSIYRFNLVCEPKFEVFTLHFLNRFGGFESRDFTKVSRKTINIEKSEFGKLPYTMDSSGNISYHNSNKVYNETRSIYASQYKEKMVLNTDILTDAEYVWLGDLVLSPMIYMQMGDYFIPIVVTSSDYEFKKTINDDLTNLTLNIEFGDIFNAQFR